MLKKIVTFSTNVIYPDCFIFDTQGIEDGNLDAIDNTDIMDTDIPLEVPLPETQYLSVRFPSISCAVFSCLFAFELAKIQ